MGRRVPAAGRSGRDGRIATARWPFRRVRAGDLGPLGPLATQAALGDFALPQRGVFMLGAVSFESFTPERHLPAVAGAAV